MHMTEMECTVLALGLERPDVVAAELGMDEEECEARCEYMFQERDFDETSHANRAILETCITKSRWAEVLEDAGFDYDIMLDLVDAAYSLQDRFAARFPLAPNEWFGFCEVGVDGELAMH